MRDKHRLRGQPYDHQYGGLSKCGEEMLPSILLRDDVADEISVQIWEHSR